MRSHHRSFFGATFLLCALSIASSSRGQSLPATPNQSQQAAPHAPDGWERAVIVPENPNPVPSPRHDISGTWEPANGPGDGIQGTGSKSMPADGKHEPPYTPLGLEMLNRSKPGNGNREVLPADIDDPVFSVIRKACPAKICTSFAR